MVHYVLNDRTNKASDVLHFLRRLQHVSSHLSLFFSSLKFLGLHTNFNTRIEQKDKVKAINRPSVHCVYCTYCILIVLPT